MIWAPHYNPHRFEPGANFWIISQALINGLLPRIDRDPHSDFSRELLHRANYIKRIVNTYQEPVHLPYWTWWGDDRRPRAPLSENESLTLVNATELQVKSITSIRLDGLEDDDHIATVNEPATFYSISGRLKRREKRPV